MFWPCMELYTFCDKQFCSMQGLRRCSDSEPRGLPRETIRERAATRLAVGTKKAQEHYSLISRWRPRVVAVVPLPPRRSLLGSCRSKLAHNQPASAVAPTHTHTHKWPEHTLNTLKPIRQMPKRSSSRSADLTNPRRHSPFRSSEPSDALLRVHAQPPLRPAPPGRRSPPPPPPRTRPAAAWP